jgi:hypothetical protein
MTKNSKKFTGEKKLIFFGSKIEIYLSLGLHKKRPSYRRSLPPSALQSMKFLNFCQFKWVIFDLLDPDSESGYGSTDLIESGSNPDPKHCSHGF